MAHEYGVVPRSIQLPVRLEGHSHGRQFPTTLQMMRSVERDVASVSQFTSVPVTVAAVENFCFCHLPCVITKRVETYLLNLSNARFYCCEAWRA